MTNADFVTDTVTDTIDRHQVRRDQRAQGSAHPVRMRAGGKRGGSSARSRSARNLVATRDPVIGKWQKTKAAERSPPPV